MPYWPSSATFENGLRFVGVALLAAALCTGCDRPRELGAPKPASDVGQSQFSIRGRWPDPSRLSYNIDASGAPLAPDVYRAAVVEALSIWAELPKIGFHAASSNDVADVVFSWQRTSHGACTPFGLDTSVAHTGPLRSSTYVHFDAGRSWSRTGEDGGAAMFGTALHEVGHVLGLGHSSNPTALMHASAAGSATRLTASERDGIAALYGGGKATSGDLHVHRMPRLGQDREAATVPLRGVAPPAVTGYAIFDTDGDGDDEVLVWRTDAAGHGALMLYHFDPGPALSATVGPLFGSVATGIEPLFGTTSAGERVLVLLHPDQRITVRRFDQQSRLQARPVTPLRLDGLVDADGNGTLDEPYRATAVLARRRSGDLDGDGVLEVIAREADIQATTAGR